jgi:hypothetical protein
MLVVPLVVMIFVAVSVIAVMGVPAISSPPASAGEHEAKEQRGDSNELQANAMRHLDCWISLQATRRPVRSRTSTTATARTSNM